MEQAINQIVETIKNISMMSGPFVSFLVGVLIIILESMIPVLPLSVFITLNIIVFGNIVGYFISLGATLIGCTLSFFFFRKGFRTYFYKKIENQMNIKSLVRKISKIDLSSLVLIIAMPFTPAFLVNIAAGLSSMEYKKFILAALLGKTFMVYFWGFVGSTFLESFTNPKVLAELTVFMLLAYVLSRIVNKKFKIG